MAKKQKQILVVGNWDSNGAFVPSTTQPADPITEVNKMVVWAEKEFAKTPGSYYFIRKVPGHLTCFKQTVMQFVEGEDA
jgi:hypothetical protein